MWFLLLALSIVDLGRVEKNEAGQIVSLDLASTWITDADLEPVGQISSLRKLNLAHTRITDVGIEHLKPLENVVELNLYYAEYLTDTALAHLRGWKQLEVLNLRGVRLTSQAFEHLAQLTSLRSLDIAFTEVEDDGFEQLSSLTKLESLAAGGNRLSGSALSSLKLLPALRSLDVGGMQRVDSGRWGLALSEDNLRRLSELTELRTLILTGANLNDRRIDRPGNQLAQRTELTDISKLRSLRNLELLDLSRTPVLPRRLTALRDLPKLRELRLGLATKIDDSAIDTLICDEATSQSSPGRLEGERRRYRALSKRAPRLPGDLVAVRSYTTAESFFSAVGNLPTPRLHHFVTQREIEIAERAGRARVHPGFQAARVARDDHRQIVVLVSIGLGVLVDVQQAGVIEQRAVALRHRLELSDEVGELFDVPAADVPQDAHSTRRLDLAVRVFVMPLRGVAEPGEASQSLALGQHIRRDPGLAGGQRMDQQVALQFGDARPVAQVATFRRPLDDLRVLRRQTRNRTLQIANRGEIFVESSLVALSQPGFRRIRIIAHGVEDALLTLHPRLFLGPEQAVEEAMRDRFRRQRTVAIDPAHVALDAFAEAFLGDADLQRCEAGIAAEFAGDHLIQGRAACSATGERLAGNDGAHRRVVAVARTRQSGGRAVEAGDDMNVVAKWRQRLQAGRHFVVRSDFARNPIFLGNSVAVEPEDETGLNFLRGNLAGRGIGSAAAVEHRFERRQSDADQRTRDSDASQKRASRESLDSASIRPSQKWL